LGYSNFSQQKEALQKLFLFKGMAFSQTIYLLQPLEFILLSISMKNVVLNVDDDIMIIGFFKETLQKYKIEFRIEESTCLIDSTV